MKTNLLVLLDYARRRIIKIHLSDEEMNESLLFASFENYISSCLEDKYNFKLYNCSYMFSDGPVYEEIYR